ncbi:hypothetical protein DYB30_010733 [Aphanomyces astaci]|uniref:DDE-1 domain-containing protein n=1 Tax=Aphanomyces astaci TaxID=112090 RepID=A0A397CV88_APHAT|nr:hypothetical protein DYB30_010733 [Aphanomyces astaci]
MGYAKAGMQLVNPKDIETKLDTLSASVMFARLNRVFDDKRALTTTHMITWIKINQRTWLMSYLATKKSDVAYDSLLRLLHRFCQHFGFSRQRRTKNKVKQAVLTEVHDEFTRDFHREYQSYENNCVFNVDETWMYYNLPATYIWAVPGGSAKISTGKKHSMRMTAVLKA